MSRRLRLQLEDGIYHVTSRGTEKRAIFLDTEDRAAFLSIARTVALDHDWSFLSFCLMPNHFHLVVRTRQANLSRGMQRLKGGYATRFNRRHDRWGALFGQRFDSRLIQREEYLLSALRYVALNPVKDGFCEDPLDWRWSAHAVLLGAAIDTGFVDVRLTLSLLDEDPERARRRYTDLVAAQDAAAPPSGTALLGDEAFGRAHLPAARPHRDLPIRQWGEGRPPLESLITTGSGPELVRAVRGHGYTFVEVAPLLGVHPMTVSRRLRRFESERSESG